MVYNDLGMDLPILKATSSPTTQTLVRYFHQAESQWTAHLAEPTPAEFGTMWINPQLARVRAANRMLDVALPPGMSPRQAFEAATAEFASQRSTCWQWVLNPSATEAQTRPMIEFLLSVGYAPRVTDILHLDRIPPWPEARAAEQLTIIPARASFRHARALHEQWAAAVGNESQLADAAMLHLDDPHYDALLALKQGTAVAHVGVLAMGEIGVIQELYVAEAFRGQHIGTAMMWRALEICARSLFKHVFAGVAPDDAIAQHLFASLGFHRIGQFVMYDKPD
jgi:ribosomal protein S18 acetylase RimI-like enzyme